ncbi:MAG: hypothetical protein ABI085_07355 [Gemmatimonadaceae bacterium]
MSVLTVLIAGDESVARARLRRLLSDEPDVEMLELTAFEVLEALPRGRMPAFVFVTASNEYALEAFAVNALDYLLKPFDAA